MARRRTKVAQEKPTDPHGPRVKVKDRVKGRDRVKDMGMGRVKGRGATSALAIAAMTAAKAASTSMEPF